MQAPAPTRRTLLAGLAASMALAATPTARAAGSSQDWASIDLLDAQNHSFRLTQSPQPLTLVTLWANWCGACLRELDTVQAIAPAIGADKLRVILVSHPDDWFSNQAITASRGLTLSTARPADSNAPGLLQRALLSADGTFYVPRSILFDRASGQVVWSHTGGLDWRRPEALGRLRQFTG